MSEKYRNQAAYAERCRVKGLCPGCGQRPLVEGRKRCKECLAKSAAATRKFNHENIKAGLCMQCGKPKYSQKQVCHECGDRKNRTRKRNRDKRKAQGLCTECGLPTLPGRTTCAGHYKISIEKGRQLANRRKEAGLCYACGKNPAVKGRCEICVLKYTAHDLWKDRSRWPELLALLNKNQRRCPYTGRLVVVGVNAEIDHRLAKSRGGTDDIENLQWVDEAVNWMKRDHLEEDFLKLADEVSHHRRPTSQSLQGYLYMKLLQPA